jgi:hypothetical protein
MNDSKTCILYIIVKCINNSNNWFDNGNNSLNVEIF